MEPMGSLDRKVLWVCGMALGVFLGVCCFSYYKTRDFIDTTRQLTQVHQVMEDLESILKDISEAKSSQRDFIITGQDAFLQSCQSALFSINDQVMDIRKVGRSGGGLEEKLEALNSLLVQEITFFRQTIAARRDGGFNQAVQMIQGAEGMESMDRIRQLVVDLKEDQRNLAERQAGIVRGKAFQISLAFWGGFALDCVLLLILYRMIHQEMKGRWKAERELNAKGDQLNLVLQSMMNGVVAAGTDGRFFMVNPASEKLLGIDPGAVPPLEEWPFRLGIFHPDGQTPFKPDDLPLARVLRGEECQEEVLFICNPKVPHGLYLSVNGVPLRNASGEVIGGIVVHADVNEKKKIEKMILKDNEFLKLALDKMERYNHEITMLVNLLESLQACLSEKEVAKTVVDMMQSMFPDTTGCILTPDLPKNRMEVLASFGEESTTQSSFSLDDCWAMRRNQAHLSGSTNTSLVCNHLSEREPLEYLCVPLAAQGQMVGMLHIGSRFEGKLLERQKKLALLMAEQIALALANLRLRESLRNQSIRDALTGLYNRRYMEEQLEKEVNRSGRDGRKLSALMIDIDHFKEFNDRHGHAAGDTVLGSVGTLLNRMGRKSDLTCRYGGEELVVLFPETRLEDALDLADRLRLAIKELALEHRGQPLGPVTVSVGVATCPDDGKTAAELLRAADIALYHAKATGRDRVSAWRDIPEAKDRALPEPSPGGAGFFIHTANSPDGTNGKFT